MFKAILIAVAFAAASGVQAQPAAAAGSDAAKKELVARVLQLQQPGIETLARTLAQQPAAQLMQQAAVVLQRIPAERREALVRDIEADVRKYVEEVVPVVREQAVKLAPSTIGVLIEERFTEDELRQIIAMLESPVNRKFQAVAPEMQRSLGERLVGETRGTIEPKLRALDQTLSRRLAENAPGAAGAPGTAASAPR